MAEDLGKERLKILGEIGNLTKQINAFNEAGIQDTQKANDLNKERLKLARELRAVNQQIRNEQRQLYVDATDSVKSLGSLYDNLKKSEMKRIEMMRSAGDLSNVAVERGNTLAGINQKIAQLTSDQSLEREILQDQFDAEIKKFERQKGISEEILNNLREQNQTARAYSDLTEGQKEQLEAQLHAYDAIKKTIGGILDTASLLTKGPAGFLGSVLIGAGMFEHKLAEVKMQLGGISDIGTTALSFIDDNAVENVKALSDEFGGISNVSAQLQASTSLISTNMGITGTEAASLIGSFSRLNGNSESVALDMTKTTQEFAKQNGIIPSKLMADLANSAEAFALFGKDGGENILRAAGYAQKLGVGMDKITGLADNLLDFETSIQQEMKLSALMGQHINLNKARALAYDGKLEEAAQETLRALGGQAAFNKMDYFQKKASAELLGVSVAELEKMVSNQENANELGTTLAQKFSIVGESISAGMNKYLGVGLEGLGGMVIAMGQMNNGLKSIGLGFDGIGQKIGGGLKKLLMWPIDKIKGAFGKGGAAAAATPTPTETPAQSKGGGMMEKFGKMDMKKVVQGAAAILILSAALFVAAKAFQEFGSVTWEAVAMGLVGLTGLATIAFVLGKASGQMIQGAIAVAVLGAALIPFAFAMSLISGLDISSVLSAAAGLVIFSAAVFGLGALMSSGVGAVVFGAGILALVALGGALVVLGLGMMAVGKGMELLNTNLAGTAQSIVSIGEHLAPMFGYIAPIAGLSLALLGLAGSLTAVGAAGLFALPTLGALGLVSGAAGAVSGVISGIADSLFGSDENDDSDALLQEMRGLRADLKSGKVAVYIDGRKVTGTVASISSKTAANSYSI